MLRFASGFAVALIAFLGTIGTAGAQTPETIVVAAQSKHSKAHRSSEPSATQTGAASQPTGAAVPPLPEPKAAKAAPIAPPPPDVWTAAEIDDAKAQCAEALKGLDAVVEPQPPIKEGSCGTPAPIRLVRMGKVTFTPAALINCRMLAPLNTWISKDLQPLAARQLGGKIVNIEVMSDYSCRTALGRVGKKLSEHAYVDALDIRGFVTEKGQQVHVLDAWGATNRDIAAAAAAAKAQEDKLASAQAAASGAQSDKLRGTKSDLDVAPAQAGASGKTGTPGRGLAKSVQSGGMDVMTAILPGGSKKQQVAARLGGPGEAAPGRDDRSTAKAGKVIAAITPDALATPPTGPKARFLREAHAAACRIFGTTLGPEANEMHRNHFHVDMAERKIKKICD